MRSAIEAELTVFLEAADPYMRPVLGVSKNVLLVESHLSKISEQSVRDRGRIGKPAHEKETYRAYSAFGALLFGNAGPTASVQSRNKSGTLPGTQISGLERWHTPTRDEHEENDESVAEGGEPAEDSQ
jgi:hypothetical protein